MPKQSTLPGVEVAKIPALSRACTRYLNKKQEWVNARKPVQDAKATVIALLHDNAKELTANGGPPSYVHKGRLFTLKPQEQLSVKPYGEDAPEELDEDAAEEAE